MEGAIVYRHACALGCEGIVSKRLGSPYRPGRQDCWVKVKNPHAPAVQRLEEEDLGVVADWSDEETDNPLYADDRNFYKVEKWTKDGAKVERMLYAGNNLEKARDIFAKAIKHRPRIRLTIRQ